MMTILKRLLLSFLSIVLFSNVYAQNDNPIIRRLSSNEIAESSTPSAVAYNYTMALLNNDYYKAASYMEESSAYQVIRALRERKSGNDIFDIPNWRQILDEGYELVATDTNDDVWVAQIGDKGSWAIFPDQIVKDGMVYVPGKEEPYVGIYQKTIYVACCHVSEIDRVRFNDAKWYNNTLFKISLSWNNNHWEIDRAYMVDLLDDTAGLVEPVELFELEMPNGLTDDNYSPNPIVYRLDSQQIAECKTPASVAYNFVIAMMNKDQERMEQLSIGQFKEIIHNQFDTLISSLYYDEKLNVYQWLPIKYGYEIAVLYVQDENSLVKKVYIDCIPSREIDNVGFQDVSRDMHTNVKVLVNHDSGRCWWKDLNSIHTLK